MSKYKERYKNKVGFIKQMIIARSGLHSVLRDQAEWDYDLHDYSNDGNTVYEFIIYVKLLDLDCDECEYEVSSLVDNINFYVNKLYGSFNNISFDGELNVVKNESGQVWTTTPYINMSLGSLTLEVGLHIVTTAG
jgi:hypothetical protein